MVNVVIMGDSSKYSFLGEIAQQIPIPKADLGSSDIIVTKSGMNEGFTSNKAIGLKSARLPLYTNVIFPAEYAEIKNYAKISTTLLYFVEHPINTNSNNNSLDSIRKAEFPSIAVVLYVPPRNFLESDISKYDDEIEEAKIRYREAGYTVIEYKPQISILPLILQLPSDITTNCHRERILHTIAEKRDDMDFVLRLDYDLKAEDLDLSEHERSLITRYNDQEFALASLNTVYFERARKLIFEKKRNSLIEPLLRVYKEFIADSDLEKFIFWDLDKDEKILEEKIKKQFYESTFVNYNVVFQGTEMEYAMCKDKINLITEFFKRIGTFFKVICYEVIKQHSEDRLNKMEKLAKGGIICHLTVLIWLWV